MLKPLILVAQELTVPGDLVGVDKITLSNHLAEKRNAANNSPIHLDAVRVNNAIRETGITSAAIVSLHGDLASALPDSFFVRNDTDFRGVAIDPCDKDAQGFFKPKPVLVIVEIKPGQGIEHAALVRYESFDH